MYVTTFGSNCHPVLQLVTGTWTSIPQVPEHAEQTTMISSIRLIKVTIFFAPRNPARNNFQVAGLETWAQNLILQVNSFI